jgi:hypothetical protein
MTDAFRSALREQGGLLAELAERPGHDDADPASPPRKAASGPRAEGREAEYELLLEMIYEGSRLHYEQAALGQEGALDPDVALLLGDQLYALGLERLAALGDLEAVGELGDLISLVAQARAASDPELAAAAWEAGAVAIGWGSSERHAAAKARARAEDPEALRVLRGVAS